MKLKIWFYKHRRAKAGTDAIKEVDGFQYEIGLSHALMGCELKMKIKWLLNRLNMSKDDGTDTNRFEYSKLIWLLLDKADGTSMDWAYAEAGISLAYTVEMRPTRFNYTNDNFFIISQS